jgi:type IV pilus assembly protein PilQ
MLNKFIALMALIALVGTSMSAAVENPSLSARRGQPFSLISLKHETEGELTRIVVESNAPPLYTILRPTDRLIVIDLPGGEGSRLAPEYPVRNALVDSITIRRSPADASGADRASTRIQILVRGKVRDRSLMSGNTLILELTPAEPQKTLAASQTAPSAKKEQIPNKPTETPTPNRPEYAASVKTTSSDTVTLRPATILRSVRAEQISDGVRIVVETDGAAHYRDFTLDNPSRIVVDITGVRSAVGNKIVPVNTAAVNRVRVGQPSPGVVRVVLDTRGKVSYRVTREGNLLFILIGGAAARNGRTSGVAAARYTQTPKAENEIKKAAQAEAPTGMAQAEKSAPAANPKPTTTDNASKQTPPSSSAKIAESQQPLVAQAHAMLPVLVRETIIEPVNTRTPSAQAVAAATQSTRQRSGLAFCDPGYVGGPISFDLRAGVDIRDMLRFISQQYGVNFIVDKSVGAVPVDVRVTDMPWNQVIESVLRANRLGAVCESGGRIIRIATLAAIKEEEKERREVEEERLKSIPLVTKIIRLKYARAAGSLGATGSGQSGRGGSGGASHGIGGSSSQPGSGTLLSIIKSRLEEMDKSGNRSRIEVDSRTNSLVITALPEQIAAVEDIIAKLDKPEPQVEIEARIVIANRNFLRDIGSELGAAAMNSGRGTAAMFETSSVQLQPGVRLGQVSGQGGGGGTGGTSGGTGTGSGTGGGGSTTNSGLGPNLIGPFANNALRATANSVLSLTTGLIGTSIISAALSASERKGQIRTIASPRITAQDNQTAEIVNGVQIPVQTVSNNTITTTFVTAALRLEITPQINEETGEILMHVVAENNSVNVGLAQALNSSTPGIDTQSAESIVRVQDGGTTVMGGITIDRESSFSNRTPGISRLPIIGNLFKRKTLERNADEILFFITPRIVRQEGPPMPSGYSPQRSSIEPKQPASGDSKVASAAASSKSGQ